MKLLLILGTFFYCTGLQAQSYDFKELNLRRIETNRTGILVLGSWGGANIVSGVTGLAVSDRTVWQSFHGMNAAWGAVNGVIALGGYMGARKELQKDFNYDEAYSRYKSNKRLYLVNAGLDVLYIGTGIVLSAYSTQFRNPDLWLGFGRSFAMQGLGLLAFDCAMYIAHQKHNKRWVQAVGGIGFTGNGFSYTYRF
ncbi:MAG: hypothetical protein K8F30_13305 [Taibaiella sp.]|nr:hypothetical protein [Taibaiella sp.]